MEYVKGARVLHTQLLQLKLDVLGLENALSTIKMIKIKFVSAGFRACSTFLVQNIHTFAEPFA